MIIGTLGLLCTQGVLCLTLGAVLHPITSFSVLKDRTLKLTGRKYQSSPRLFQT